jgi:hypothetical protein
MLKREQSHDKGGILADDMGVRGPRSSHSIDSRVSQLGKTVQMIATMAMNLPADDEELRTTLIVVPAALLQQVRTCVFLRIFLTLHSGRTRLKARPTRCSVSISTTAKTSSRYVSSRPTFWVITAPQKTSEVKGYDVGSLLIIVLVSPDARAGHHHDVPDP